ncbi:MAG: DMT family transporter [Pseudomonadota bacterium]
MPFAVGTIVFTVFAMSVGDALIKGLGTDNGIGLWQLFAIRSALLLPIFFSTALVVGLRTTLMPQRLGWAVLRACLLAAVWVTYYTALPHVPFSVAAAALYTLPLFIVGLSAVFTKDRVTLGQAVAALIGFIGVVLVLRPSGEAFTPYALLPILSALLFAAAMVVTRLHGRNEHPLALAFTLHLTFIIVGVIGVGVLSFAPHLIGVGFLTAAWLPLGTLNWQLMALLAISILIASVGTAIAYQKAPGSVLGTFEFSYVGFATIWGVLFFAERPDMVTLFGLSLIVVSGILVVRQS